jgi:hypothetical protein
MILSGWVCYNTTGIATTIDPNIHMGWHWYVFYSGNFEGGKKIHDHDGSELSLQIYSFFFPTTSIYPLLSFSSLLG